MIILSSLPAIITTTPGAAHNVPRSCDGSLTRLVIGCARILKTTLRRRNYCYAAGAAGASKAVLNRHNSK